MDLLQEGLRDRLTWRKFTVLVRNLPMDSAYARWLGNKENRDLVEQSEDDIFDAISSGRG